MLQITSEEKRVFPWRREINPYCVTVHPCHHWLRVVMSERLVLPEAAPHILRGGGGAFGGGQESFLSLGSEQTLGSSIQSSAGRMLAMLLSAAHKNPASPQGTFEFPHRFLPDFLSAPGFSPPVAPWSSLAGLFALPPHPCDFL